MNYKKRILISAAVIVGAAFLVAATTSGQILSRYFDDRDIPENAAVIVLGCGLSPGDRLTPSTMLTLRLEAAEKYIAEHPGAAVILSGGQGENELVSEAEAMRRWFDERGYDTSSFLLEDKSVNTEENLRLSRELYGKEGAAVIITDGFHQFRAHYYAKKCGFTPYSVSSYAPAHLQFKYWLREIVAIVLQIWL
ncbi:hypothetical protein FACS1894202_04600 [Clostridia bacterium]|nr:hypothetical protein FACS1894202_04600 [Clostridia bacterium]